MEKKPLSLRTKLLIGSAIAVVLVGSALAALRYELLQTMAVDSAHQQESMDRLTHKLVNLESEIAALAAVPHPDTASFEALRQESEGAKATLVQLNERLTTIEKRPMVMAPPPAPVAVAAPLPNAAPVAHPSSLAALTQAAKTGAPYPAELAAWDKDHPASIDKIRLLRQNATTGAATDDRLKAQLVAILDRQNAAAPVPADGIMGRLNAHLAGWVSIKKQGAAQPEATTLRAMSQTSSVDAIAAYLIQLPAASQAVYTPWLETARARNAALAELATLPALEVAP